MLPLFALAVLPGAIAVALLTKDYVVGLTDRRLIVLRFKGKNVSVQEVMDYRYSLLPNGDSIGIGRGRKRTIGVDSS